MSQGRSSSGARIGAPQEPGSELLRSQGRGSSGARVGAPEEPW